MPLKDELSGLISHYADHASYIAENSKLYEAYDGNLAKLVRGVMQETLSPRTFDVAKQRISPINLLRKVVDKLSTIYQQNPARQLDTDDQKSSELLKWLEESFRINRTLNLANEFTVMSKVSAVMPYVHKNKPRLRALPANKFIVYSNDPVDPTHVTHFATIQGKCTDKAGQPAIKYHVWTDTEFAIVNSKGEILRDEMLALGNPQGINPYGKIPAVYINRSDSDLVPIIDSDMLQMTILVPLILSDLNVGAMFTIWPILWTRDVDLKDMVYSPNTVVNMHTDPSVDKVPEIGTIEPKMDIPNQLALLQAEIGLWLSTKNIRPGAIGELTPEQFASGISKMIDEGDTVEERKRQVEIFKDVEERLWDLVINYMYPVWVKAQMIETRTLFVSGAKVHTDFPMQLPLTGRGQVVRDLRDEVEAGFMSKREAIKRLNPHLTEREIDQFIAEIDGDDSSKVTVDMTVTQPAEKEETPEAETAGDGDEKEEVA
jgi:hypothetical protein